MVEDEHDPLCSSGDAENAAGLVEDRQEADEAARRTTASLLQRTKELADSLALMRATLEATNDAILATDADGNIADFNEHFVSMWQLSPDFLSKRSHRELIERTSRLVSDPQSFLQRIDDIRGSADETTDELRLLDGRVIERYSKVQIVEQQIIGRVWSFHDVTAKRVHEDSIRAAHERFVDIVNHSPVGMVLLNSQLRIEHVNPAARPALPGDDDIVGAQLESVLSTIWPPAVVQDQLAIFQRTLVTGEPYFSKGFSGVRQDSGVKEYYDWQLHRLTLPNGEPGVACYFVDVSDFVHAQTSLRESEERWRAAFNQAAVGMAIARLDGSFEQINSKFSALLGYSVDELRTMTFFDLTHPEDQPQTRLHSEALLSGAVPQYTHEKRYCCKDGSTVWSLTSVTLLRDDQGNPQRYIGVLDDITARKLAEEEARETSDRMQFALAAGRLGDWSWDASSDSLNFSARAASLFGLPSGEEVAWDRLEHALADDNGRHLREAMQAALAQGADLDAQYRVELPSGESRWLAVKARPVRAADDQVTGLIGVVHDVTERKVSEGIQARLAAVVESSQDAIITTTLDGVITTWNNGAERMFGYSPEEAIGLHTAELVPPGLVEGEHGNLQKLKRGVPLAHYQTRRVRKDGQLIDVSITASPVRDQHGRIVGASKIARDITETKRAEATLRRSEVELRTLADSIPQLAWMANPDGNIFWYNRRWYDYTGTTPEAMEGWGWQSVHDPGILPSVVERWKHSLAEGTPFEMEFPLRGADGRFRWFLTRVNPFRDDDGRIIRWFGTNTDVDEVKRVEHALREETRSLELLNSTSALVGSTLDLQQLVQAVTDASTKLSGAEFGAFFYNSTDSKGDAYLLYTLSGAPREAFEQFGQPRATPLFGPTFNGEQPIRSDDIQKDPRYGQMAPHYGMPAGHLPVRSYLAVPVISRTGTVLGGLFFGHSEVGVFSERIERLVVSVASQAAVAIDNAQLYEGLKAAAAEREELLKAERAARSEAERVSVMKDEFLATLSHELRTPLNAILGWSQLLSTGKMEPGDLEQGLDAIQRNARAQTQLIEDLLDMSRIVSGKVRLDVQWTDLAGIVSAAVDSVRPSADAKNLRLRKIIDPHAGPVAGDPTRLQQIVWNLLTNAVKFTPKGGKIDVYLERVNSHLEITVRDSGAGIKPEYLPVIFERFRQADSSTTRSYGGLGLGLSIVRNLVELHGGTVSVESDGENQGATFVVALPLAPVRTGKRREHPTTPNTSSSPTANLDLAGINVLVVDDEPDALALIRRVLTQYNAEVAVAASAEEGLRELSKQRPHVLVSDIGMPEKDGYQFIREVRSLAPDQGGRTPAIALTAFARSEDRTRAMIAGYQVHISKPIEPQELAATVGSLAGRMGAQI